MVQLCEEQGITLLCYGTMAGGLLSERYLDAPEPMPPFENRSLTKYKLIIDEFGGWRLFQQLLRTMQGISRRHGVSIAAVATRYILQKKAVGAAIVGARHARHLPATLRTFGFVLSEGDLDAIRSVTDRARGPDGEVYALERMKDGKHAKIMKYNLNQSGTEG
jgi:aryl-alcohol dehydrogenase-like predicted oxidoreductase